jgi:endopeptidase La
MRLIARAVLAAFLVSLPGSGEVWAQVSRAAVAGEAGLAPTLALPSLGAPAVSAPSLLLSPALLAPSPLAPSAAAPVALQAVVAAAAKGEKPAARATLAVAAAQIAKLTPKTGAADSKEQAGRAFEGGAERRPSSSEVSGFAGAGPEALPRSGKSAPAVKTIPPLPVARPTLGSRARKLWPIALTAAAVALTSFILYKFGQPAAGLLPFLGLAGTLWTPSPGAKAAFLDGIKGAAAPGTIVSYAKVGELGARLGFDADQAGALFTELLQEGHLAIRDNRDAVYYTFRTRAEAPGTASALEHAGDVFASNAAVLMNSANAADHARSVAKADLAVAAYEKAGLAAGKPLPQLEEAKALRANAMLEFFTGLLTAHKNDLDGRENPTPKLAARAADAGEALAWLKTATYEAGRVPPMPEGVHRKLVALIGSLNPQEEDGQGAAGQVADGYIAALDLLEKYDPRDFLYAGPSKEPSPEGSWKPDDKQTAAFAAEVRSRTSAGATVTRETMMRAGRSLDLDAAGINAAVSALAAQGQVMILANGSVVYFDLREQASDDEDGIWDLHNEAFDAIKLANAPDAASHLRAVSRLDAVLGRYFSEAGKSRAIEQVSIALANAKLEAIASALRPREKSAAVEASLSFLAKAYYSAERRQDISAEVAKALEEAATLDALRTPIGSKKDAELERGANLTREFLVGMKAGGGSNRAPKAPRPGKDRSLASLEDLQAKTKALGMPESIREIAAAEYVKLERMDPQDSEAQKIRTYIEWLTDLPWSARTEDTPDIAAARNILDKDHAGLETVKERVLEFLAVRKRTGSKKGAIIAFTGPPGTGKTSIASAIAQALGRKFVRLSLGGVHDESVLRGHGRTYVGSMPGEIMRQMKAAGTINPVMLMDEVDKIGRDGNQGDPTAALLEILDPEQNNTFRDRYLDVPYDLSEVLFIVTSNELSHIPGPLRDRMEIIEFDGYTTLEKLDIAEKHVVPQKRELVGLKEGEASLTKNALRAIIEGYTMEAGVRGLREKIETLLRKISAWTETRGEAAPAVVDETMVAKYLGVERFSARPTAQNGIGVATGLAVNAYGGSTLNVEVSQEPGTGRLLLRKQFGDDIEDSAMNAYKYVKTHAAQLGLEGFDFTKYDVDINITPAGKVDGPSAGGLMVTAIVSALTGRPVKAGVAMTGEITMRGDILPIGGLKQKVMAAHRMGYKEVIFPWANLKDLENIPKEVRDAIKLTPARTYDDIFPAALE